MAAIIKYLLITLIAVYRYMISPVLGCHCRYTPSCSCYANEAISTHGAMKGGLLTLRRLLRCHPWGGAGYDPVPEQRGYF